MKLVRVWYDGLLRIYFVTHIFIGSSTLNVGIYMYSENRRGIYFSPQKRLKRGRQNITLPWINGIIRNNKCIFTKLNAVFILNTAAWTNFFLQRLIPSQIPDRFSKLLSSTAVPLRFSQFSGCWLILSVYIIMSFDFPFVRLFGVR